jgi:phosphoribosylanthranilate isomerase
MTWIKVCGMTNLEDALLAVEAGADAVGFVFYEKSPRNVSVEMARRIVKKLPERIEKVGVFAGGSIEQAVKRGRGAGFDALQLYILTFGEASSGGLHAQAIAVDGLRTYLALPISLFLGGGSKNLDGFARQRPDGVLDPLFVDSGSSQQPGGTGRTFNWREAAKTIEGLGRHQKIVIAGGLTPANVVEAITILKPWGVDVASGVEARPGKKDPEKVRAFIKAVREIDQKTS